MKIENVNINIGRFTKYLKKILKLQEVLQKIHEDCQNPRIELHGILTTMIHLLVMGEKSALGMDRMMKRCSMLTEIIDGKNFSDTTLQRRLEGIDIGSVREALYGFIKKSNRRKVIVGEKVIFTVDGTGGERAYRKRCPLCHETESGYIHKFVMLMVTSDEVNLIVDIEPIYPGEGETKAAERLVTRAKRYFKRLQMILVIDALYKAPQINVFVDKGIEVVVRIKEERLEIIKDAKGLFREVEPECGFDYGRLEVYRLKDIEGFESWEGLKKPLRVLEIEEERLRPKRKEETYERFYVGTTLKKQEVSGNQIRNMIHKRWHEENNGFRNLKNFWALGHTIRHEIRAIQVVWLIMGLAFNCLELFIRKNLYKLRNIWERKKLSFIEIRKVLVETLIEELSIKKWQQAIQERAPS